MIDLKFNIVTNDLVVENGDIFIVSGKENLTQRIKDMLQSRVGDYVYDIENGLPWVDIVQKQYSLKEIQVLVKTLLLSDNEIIDVTEITVENNNDNEMVISVKVRTVYGELEVNT